MWDKISNLLKRTIINHHHHHYNYSSKIRNTVLPVLHIRGQLKSVGVLALHYHLTVLILDL